MISLQSNLTVVFPQRKKEKKSPERACVYMALSGMSQPARSHSYPNMYSFRLSDGRHRARMLCHGPGRMKLGFSIALCLQLLYRRALESAFHARGNKRDRHTVTVWTGKLFAHRLRAYLARLIERQVAISLRAAEMRRNAIPLRDGRVKGGNNNCTFFLFY